MLKQIHDWYHGSAQVWLAWLGAGLIAWSMTLPASQTALGEVLVALGGGLGGAVLVPELTKSIRAFVTAGGLVALGGAITLLARCETAAATLAYCPPAAWVVPLVKVLTGAATFLKAGAWVPQPDPARVSTLPAPPKS